MKLVKSRHAKQTGSDSDRILNALKRTERLRNLKRKQYRMITDIYGPSNANNLKLMYEP
jgi:hypothetical protein